MLADFLGWLPTCREKFREMVKFQSMRTPVDLVGHTLAELNDGLAHCGSFLWNIFREIVWHFGAVAGHLGSPCRAR